MTAYLAQDFLCRACSFSMAALDVRPGRIYVYCQNRMCTEYNKVGSYPLQEVHLQPEEVNG